MAPLDFLKRPIVFWDLGSSHQWSADRIRKQLLIGADDLDGEAERLTEASFNQGAKSSDDEEDEHDMKIRADVLTYYEQNIERTVSHLWGLGIAGIYHQWERNVRDVIAHFENPTPPPEKLERADFSSLCKHLEKLKYPIRKSAGFDGLNLGRLIANTIKHGGGKAFRDLVGQQPELFPIYHRWIRPRRPGNLPDPEDLRVGVTEFDHVAKAIALMWPELEDAIAPGTRW